MAKRGAQGDGTIRKRPDGRWEARYSLGRDPGSGKQRQRSIYGSTQNEARIRLKEITRAIESGTYIETPDRYTVGKWVDTWCDTYLSDIKRSTQISYRQHCANHIKPALGATKLSALRPDTVQAFINSLTKEKGLSPKTCKNVFGVLHAALKRACILKYIAYNPADNVILPRIERKDIRPFDNPDLIKLLDNLDTTDIYQCCIKFDLLTGLRLGEILGLKWTDIDFNRGIIIVSKQLSRPRVKGDQYALTSLKNDKTRTIKPAPMAMALLKDHKKAQAAMRLRVGSNWNDEGFPDLVFTLPTGKHLCYNVVERHYQKVLNDLGIDKRTFHALRHSYAVNSLRAGDPVKVVQQNLGHFSAAFTLDTYGHVTDTMMDVSAQNMERFIAGIK